MSWNETALWIIACISLSTWTPQQLLFSFLCNVLYITNQISSQIYERVWVQIKIPIFRSTHNPVKIYHIYSRMKLTEMTLRMMMIIRVIILVLVVALHPSSCVCMTRFSSSLHRKESPYRAGIEMEKKPAWQPRPKPSPLQSKAPHTETDSQPSRIKAWQLDDSSRWCASFVLQVELPLLPTTAWTTCS